MLIEQSKSRRQDSSLGMIDRPSIWAVVPVKPLREGKTRLAGILSISQRARLVADFLRHHLDILKQVSAIGQILVVSSDPVVLASARQQNVSVMDEGQVCGLNLATSRAVRLATRQQAAAVLILPVDLPLMQVGDVVKMIQAGMDHGALGRPVMSICPDIRQQGTNALFLNLPSSFTFQYGEGSFQRHLREAVQLGLIPQIVRSPRLELDIDLEDDWSLYQQMLGEQDRVSGRSPDPF